MMLLGFVLIVVGIFTVSFGFIGGITGSTIERIFIEWETKLYIAAQHSVHQTRTIHIKAKHWNLERSWGVGKNRAIAAKKSPSVNP